MSNTLSQYFLQELNFEYRATRQCLERIPETKYSYQPHPKSMNLGYLALLVAEIPLWIQHMITEGEIDLATFAHFSLSNTAALSAHFEENMEAARKALQAITDNDLEENFSLKTKGQVLYTSPKKVDIGVTLNHWVHHRGQLTVYMRMNDILVPSIYGPSADEKSYAAPK